MKSRRLIFGPRQRVAGLQDIELAGFKLGGVNVVSQLAHHWLLRCTLHFRWVKTGRYRTAALAAASPQLTDIRRGKRQCDAGAGPALHEAVEEYRGPRWWDGEHGFWGVDLSTRHPPPQ